MLLRNSGEPLALALGRLVSSVRYEQLPPRAIEVAKTGVADCLAVAIAGHEEEPVQALRRVLGPGAGSGEAALWGPDSRICYSAPDAAWINGTAGHVLDYDDVALGHPSVVIVPALLAEGELLGSSGADVIAAYVAGYEAWTELVRRERGAYQLKGWHPTSTLGALASAAACANLRKLDAEQSAHALGIAAAQAGGIVANYGTMTKSVQVGKAAHTGVLSARLACQGLRSTIEALDHQHGFLKAISPAGDVDVQSPPRAADDEWHICRYGLNIKRYPVCYFAHRSIDAMLELADRHQLQPQEIDQIEVAISKMHATVLKHHEPRNGLSAKFSVEFAVAAAVIAGNVGLSQLGDEFVCRRDVQELMRRVRVSTNEDYDPETPGFSRWDEVAVQNVNGTRLSTKVRYAKGNAQAPLSQGDLELKFLDCVATGNPRLDSAKLLEKMQCFERLKNCRDLFANTLAAAEAGNQ